MAAAVATVLLLAACGTSAAPSRPGYAAALATLCDRSRATIEALGQTTTPAALERTLPKQIAEYRRFLRRASSLVPPPAQRRRAREWAAAYGLWIDGSRYTLQALRAKDYNAVFRIQDGALIWLRRSEALARALGAPECARRPFSQP